MCIQVGTMWICLVWIPNQSGEYDNEGMTSSYIVAMCHPAYHCYLYICISWRGSVTGWAASLHTISQTSVLLVRQMAWPHYERYPGYRRKNQRGSRSSKPEIIRSFLTSRNSCRSLRDTCLFLGTICWSGERDVRLTSCQSRTIP